jgi:hypothetical protein
MTKNKANRSHHKLTDKEIDKIILQECIRIWLSTPDRKSKYKSAPIKFLPPLKLSV